MQIALPSTQLCTQSANVLMYRHFASAQHRISYIIHTSTTGHGDSNESHINKQENRHCLYNVQHWRVSVTIVAVKKQQWLLFVLLSYTLLTYLRTYLLTYCMEQSPS